MNGEFPLESNEASIEHTQQVYLYILLEPLIKKNSAVLYIGGVITKHRCRNFLSYDTLGVSRRTELRHKTKCALYSSFFAGAAAVPARPALRCCFFLSEQLGLRGRRGRHGNDRGSFEGVGCLRSRSSLCWRYVRIAPKLLSRCFLFPGFGQRLREPCLSV